MDLLITGDIHIGGNRRDICQRVMDFVLDEAERRNVAAVGVSGDWYHASSSEHDRLYTMEVIGAGTRRRPWILISGNHDVEYDLEPVARFASVCPVHVFDTPEAATITTKDGPLLVACLSDLRGKLLARRLDKMPKGATRLDAARAALADLGAELALLAELADTRVPRLFLGHATLGTAVMDNDQPARGADLTFALEHLREVDADAYALGHIHLRQSWLLDGRPVFYPGAPYATTYGDLGPRSITILHWDGKRFDVEHVPTPAPRLVHLVGTWRRSGGDAGMQLAYGEAHATDLGVAVADLAGADVRLQYTEPLDDTAAAERAATEHVAAIRAAGAVRCTPDPRPAHVVRTRTHALAAARTTAEKVTAYWAASNTLPEQERRERVLAHLARLEPGASPEPPVSLVRVDSMEWTSIGPLKGGSLTLPAGLHAVTGPNRVGKSTLLSILTAGVWVSGPKGSLDKLGKKAGARTKLSLAVHEGAWTITQKVPSTRVEVRDPAGAPVHDGGREPFYEWADARLPSEDVLGQVAFLKGNSLLDLVDAKLKDALLVLGGSSKFAALAKAAREELGLAEGRREAAARAIAAAGDPAAARDVVASRLATARMNGEQLTQERARIARSLELAAERRRLEEALRGVDGRRATARGQRASLFAAQGDAARIRAAARAHAAAGAARASAEAEERRIASEITSLRRSIAELGEERARAGARAADAEARGARLAARLAAREACAAAVLALPEARARLLAAEGAVGLAAKSTDAEQLRQALQTIRTTASGARLKPSVRFLDAGLVRVRDLADDALKPKEPKETLAAVMKVRDEAARIVADLDQKARLLTELDAAAAEQEMAARAAEEERLVEMIVGARERDYAESLPGLDAERAEAAARARAEAATEAEHAPLARRLADVERAEGAIAALDEQLAALDLEYDRADAAVKAAEVPTTVPPGRAVEVERLLAGAIREAARLEEVLAGHQRAVDRLAAEREKLAAAERDHGDLTELLRVLDRDGVQAYEAAAVGEAIADDASDLLEKHGFRWVIRFDATRPTAKQKRYVEQARWTIVDTATGDEYDARARGGGASDGEEVIAATAVFLGAAIGVVRRGLGVPDATFTLDERTGAIRGELVEQWLAMLRDGAARAKARTVLLVPPNDQKLIDACDGVIIVSPTDSGSIVRT